ncbi:NrdH-redoxin [Candidatus Pacearchaeota archaeon RBG_13_36_9]|nr:MAG: NrdH-redoxin [Candidatus Pacearchaeota archaeon RBG_13_36_9]
MKVTLYTAPACPFCMIVKKYLERNKIEFIEVNISKNQKKKEEMKKKSNQSQVPVVDADGTIVVGYNLKKLKEALKLP